jgi:DNA modification methylase
MPERSERAGGVPAWPADKVERWPLDRLVPYARNARTHSDAQVAQIAASIREWGWTVPVLVDEQGGLLAGHCRVEAARKLGLADVPVMVAAGWSTAQKRAYVLADNKLALNAGWDPGLLRVELADLKKMGADLQLVGFDARELAGLLDDGGGRLTDPDKLPAPPVEPVTRRGDLWGLGRHRVICGDATQPDAVARLFGGASIDCILTDPPYCSGGFQEAGKSAGSIGTRMVKTGARHEGGIANDKLSTRGYLALMKAVLGLVDAPILYAFTDWRMWINLYDVAESSGFGIRNMVVWDKGTPGMGRGWRTQHELVAFGARSAVDFSPSKAQGNVIASKRTGNKLHPTQKPVDLLEAILGVTDMALNVYDPFGGSGTTLMACETTGRCCFAAELSPQFVDVIIRRWQDFTGQEATLEGDGRAFAEIAAERVPGAQAAE